MIDNIPLLIALLLLIPIFIGLYGMFVTFVDFENHYTFGSYCLRSSIRGRICWIFIDTPEKYFLDMSKPTKNELVLY